MTSDSIPWKRLKLKRFLLGICHFPEQEPAEYLQRDAELMAQAGIETVRMGEFAWSVLEPQEGKFDFSLFDNAISVLGSFGIDTIFCTPTATPPRWLTHRYPEILRVDESGRALRHGSRQHVDITHPLFREQSRRITQALANHYADNRNVVGWQTDNELNTHFSETHSEGAQMAFREWLSVRYNDITTLNKAWGTVFWNRQYDSFEQIETPINNRPASADPSHLLDYRRFLADMTRDFQRDQVRILRNANPDWFVFHNIGRLNDTDLREFGADLDFLGMDLYPGIRDEFMKAGLGYAEAMQIDSFRGWGGNFIIPEMQLGSGAHPGFAIPTPEPGELKRFALSAVSRGADGLLWFRWTSARYGAEAYWLGALDHDRVPRRRFYELGETIAELKSARNAILGTVVETPVVILAADWENEMAQATFSLGLPSLAELALPLHHHCYLRNIGCGFASPQDDITEAKIAFIPHLALWNDDWTGPLKRFVEEGGVLVVGARTATRDVNNHVLAETPPGPIAELCGVRIAEFGRLPALGATSVLTGPVFQVENVSSGRMAESARRDHIIRFSNEEEVQAAHGYEIVEPDDGVEIIGRWNSRFLKGKASITRRRLGRGSIIYVGTYLTHKLVAQLFEPLFAELGIKPVLQVPAGVEVATRKGEDGRITFIQNTTSQPHELDVAGQTFNLEPFGTAILGLPIK